MQRDSDVSIEGFQELFQNELEEEAELYEALLDRLEKQKTFQSAWLVRDREELFHQASPIFDEIRSKYRVTHFYFIDLESVCFLRVHQKDRQGDTIERVTLKNAIGEGKTTYGIELGPLGTFTLRVVRPWRIDGKLVGYLEIGQEIEHLAPEMKEVLKTELIFLIKKTYVKRTGWEKGMKMLGHKTDWDQFSKHIIISNTISYDLSIVNKALMRHETNEHEKFHFMMSVEEHEYICGFVPLINAGNQEVGEVLVMYDVTEAKASMWRFIMIMIGIYTLVSITFSSFFYFFVSRIQKKLIENNETLLSEIEHRSKIEQNLKLNQVSLNKSIAELKMLYRIIPSALFTVDKNQIITSWNNKIAEITGYSAEEAIGKHCHLFTRGLCLQRCSINSDDVQKPINDRSCTIEDKNGIIHSITKNADVIRDEQGNIIGGIESFDDVTEKLKIEEEVQRNQQRYKSLFNESPVSIWEEDFSEVYDFIQKLKEKGVKDFEKHFLDNVEDVILCSSMVKILDVNQATLNMFGAKSKTDLLSNLALIFTENSLQSFSEQLIHISQEKESYQGECENETIDGRILNVIIRWSPAPDHKNYSRVLVSIIDITDRKKAEIAQKISEKKYRKMFELSPESIILIDDKGIIVDINHRVTDWLKYDAEEV
ncbi:MAG: PAS domain S-box protein, partial [Candidatus Kariarchaeaceae archaeon]